MPGIVDQHCFLQLYPRGQAQAYRNQYPSFWHTFHTSTLSSAIQQWLTAMSGFSKQSRFMRSMTPSGSVKMTPSRFNLVCGKTLEQATRPNMDRVPNPQGPKIIDSRVTTPTLSRREFSQTRESHNRAPVPPARGSSLHLPFGSYAEMGIHTKPSRYSNSPSVKWKEE